MKNAKKNMEKSPARTKKPKITKADPIKKLEENLKKLTASHVALKYKYRNIFPRMRKVEDLRATITKVYILIRSFQARDENSERMYNAAILKMQEIQKDYESLFKKWGTTITFFEKRNEGGDWIPGDYDLQIKPEKIDD